MNTVSHKIVILEENQDLIETLTDNLTRESLFMSSPEQAERVQIMSADMIIDKAAYNVYLNGEKISFPKKEFELLLLLASNPRKVFKREEILQHVWGKTFKPKDSRSLDVHIRMLRKKLSDHYITTIRGVGYKLEK